MVSVEVLMIEAFHRETDLEDKDPSDKDEADQDHQRKPFLHVVALKQAHPVPSGRHAVVLMEPAVILIRLKPVYREAAKVNNVP